MTDHTKTSPQPSIFAQKGEAQPAPAVAYVSLRQMQGKPEQRREEPDRREQWGKPQNDGDSPDRRDHLGPDHDGRRHFTPRTGLAYGQRYVPWGASEADASQDTARERKAKTTVGPLSVASLSALIHRHRDGFAQPASPESEPALIPQRVAKAASPATPSRDSAPAPPAQPEARAAVGPTKVDMSYLAAAGAQGQQTAVAISPAAPAAPQARQPPTARKRKKKRKKVTVRLDLEQYMQFKSLVDKIGESQQSVMASAVADYLDKNN